MLAASARREPPHRPRFAGPLPLPRGERGISQFWRVSCLGHETVHHLLVAGLVELDRQFVLLDRADGAVAEFLVADAVAGGEAADMGDLGAARRRAAVDEGRTPGVAALEVGAGEIEIGDVGSGAAPAPLAEAA